MAINHRFNFALGMPSYRFGLTEQMYKLLKGLNLPVDQEIFVNELSVAKARNYIAGLYLKRFAYTSDKNNVLVMIDQDTVATEAQINELVAAVNEESPIIGSNMCYRNMPGEANWFLANDDRDNRRSIIESGATGLIEVEKCGFGLIAIHKSALITLTNQANLVSVGDQYVGDLFSPEYEASGINTFKPVLLPETYSFCQRARAAGLKIKVNLSIKPGHIQESIISM